MCDTCKIADKIDAYNVPEELLNEFAENIAERVGRELTETHELFIATLIVQSGVGAVQIAGKKVREVSEKLATGRLVLNGEETEDREFFIYSLTEDTSKPEKPSATEFDALLEALFKSMD